MIRLRVLTILSLLVVCPVWAHVSIKPAYHAFKTLKPGQQVEFKALVKNTRAYPVTFASMRTTCDCMFAKLPFHILAPGKAVTLEVKYKAPLDADGIQNQLVAFNVYGLDKNGKEDVRLIEIPITADILPDYRFEPKVLDLGLVPKGELRTFTAKLTIVSPFLKTIKILKADPQMEGLEAKWRPLAPGVWEVTMTTKENLGSAVIDKTLVLTGKAGAKREVELKLPYKGQVRGAWKVSPPTLKIDSARVAGKKLRMYTQVGNLWRKNFRVNAVTDLPEWLKVKSKPGPAGSVLLEWEVDGKKMAKADQAQWPKSLTVATDVKDGENFLIHLEPLKVGKP